MQDENEGGGRSARTEGYMWTRTCGGQKESSEAYQGKGLGWGEVSFFKDSQVSDQGRGQPPWERETMVTVN